MALLKIPENYHSFLSLRQTEYAIKKVKDFFERDRCLSIRQAD